MFQGLSQRDNPNSTIFAFYKNNNHNVLSKKPNPARRCSKTSLASISVSIGSSKISQASAKPNPCLRMFSWFFLSSHRIDARRPRRGIQRRQDRNCERERNRAEPEVRRQVKEIDKRGALRFQNK